jgi:hypothetical protein
MKMYLKCFLLFGIPNGLLIGLIRFYLSGILWENIIVGFIYFVTGGFIFSFFYVTIHRDKMKEIQKGKSEISFEVNQSRHLELAVSMEKAFDICCKSLDVLGKYKTQKMDGKDGIIAVKTPLNNMTIRDIVSINLQSIEDNKTKIVVSSQPAYKIICADYGINYINVEKIVKSINSLALSQN